MGSNTEDPGGWSMVFEDRTEAHAEESAEDTSPSRLPERTVAQPAPDFGELESIDPIDKTDAQAGPVLQHFDDDDGDPPTIIDPSLAQELQAALEPLLQVEVASARDARLDNAPVDLDDTSKDAQPERTMKSPSPFDVRVTPVLDEFSETLLDPVEKTQRARVPYDLRAEQTLPPPAHEPVKKPTPVPKIIAAPVTPPAGPAPAESSERTALDLAAALGMAPEPAAPKQATPSGAAHEAEKLRVPEQGVPIALGLDTAAPGAAKRNARPAEGMRSDQIAGLAQATDRISRIIPVVLAILLVLATIGISIRMFQPDERQEHVELRFLALGNQDAVTQKSDTGTPVIIETDPPGLLVLFDRKVLGKTPYTGTVPLVLDDTVAIELSSPYFERWLGEVKQGPAGDYTINVRLERRARR